LTAIATLLKPLSTRIPSTFLVQNNKISHIQRMMPLFNLCSSFLVRWKLGLNMKYKLTANTDLAEQNNWLQGKKIQEFMGGRWMACQFGHSCFYFSLGNTFGLDVLSIIKAVHY
ncbi:hypothetical protein ACJX0J_014586, partial [Zea mays]